MGEAGHSSCAKVGPNDSKPIAHPAGGRPEWKKSYKLAKSRDVYDSIVEGRVGDVKRTWMVGTGAGKGRMPKCGAPPSTWG